MEPKYIRDFIEIVYPGMTELAITMNDEKTILIDAVKLINALKKDNNILSDRNVALDSENNSLKIENCVLRKDKVRLDFMDNQSGWTRWAGYDTKDGSSTWPIFGRSSFRNEIDKAMKYCDKYKSTPKKRKTMIKDQEYKQYLKLKEKFEGNDNEKK